MELAPRISSDVPKELYVKHTALVESLEQVRSDMIMLTVYIHLGAFGEVRLVVHKESGTQRAVKVLKKNAMDDDEKRMLFNEINILKEIVRHLIFVLTMFCVQDHPNIIKMYEFFEDDKRYYIVTE